MKKVIKLSVAVGVTLLLNACGGGGLKQGKVQLSQTQQNVQKMNAITQEGEKVVLYDDGTWKFADGKRQNPAPTSGLRPEKEVAKRLKVSLVKKKYKGAFSGDTMEEMLEKYHIFRFEIENPTRHTVTAVKLNIRINDDFDETYVSFDESVSATIPPGGFHEFESRVKFDPFSKKHKDLQKRTTKQVKAVIEVDKVKVK